MSSWEGGDCCTVSEWGLQLRELLCPSMTKAAAPLMRMQILKVEAGKFGLGIEPSADKRKQESHVDKLMQRQRRKWFLFIFTDRGYHDHQ